MGIVSEIHQKEIEERFRDFVGYVAQRLATGPALEDKVVIAPTPIDLVKLLQQQKVDFYIESPYATYVINNVHGAANLLLRRWKRGMSEYRSLIFARRNGGINRLQDLRGKIIAFEDPGSTSGHFLPKFFLLRNGFKLAEKPRLEAPVATGEIGYVFAYSQENLVDWVLKKQAAAGAFSDDDYARLDEKKKLEIIVLAETELLPRQLVSVRSDLPPAVVARLEKILLAMHEDDEGRRILQRTDETTKFDLFPGGQETMRRRLLETFYSPQRK